MDAEPRPGAEARIERAGLRVAALALGLAGTLGVVPSAYLLIATGITIARHGLGIGTMAAMPTLFAALLVSIQVISVARDLAHGRHLTAACAWGAVVASAALVVALNGHWFARPLLFEASRCGTQPCRVSIGAQAPASANLAAIPVALWGALVVAVVVAARLAAGARRAAIVAAAVACLAIGISATAGWANAASDTAYSRHQCARVLALEAGDPDGSDQPAGRYVRACHDPVAVARAREASIRPRP